jgi:integration host factor subunit alpha
MQVFDEQIGAPGPRGYEMRSKSSAREAIPDASPASNARSRGTLTRQEIAHAVYSAYPGISRREAKVFVESVLEEIVSTLVAGEDVKLRGFGNFAVRRKGERPGRNPKTGVSAPICARRVVTFKASEILKTEAGEE